MQDSIDFSNPTKVIDTDKMARAIGEFDKRGILNLLFNEKVIVDGEEMLASEVIRDVQRFSNVMGGGADVGASLQSADIVADISLHTMFTNPQGMLSSAIELKSMDFESSVWLSPVTRSLILNTGGVLPVKPTNLRQWGVAVAQGTQNYIANTRETNEVLENSEYQQLSPTLRLLMSPDEKVKANIDDVRSFLNERGPIQGSVSTEAPEGSSGEDIIEEKPKDKPTKRMKLALIKNPEMADEFDAKFGDGEAMKVFKESKKDIA